MADFQVSTQRVHVWNTTTDKWLFYGQVLCECSKNDDNDTFTIKVKGIANYGVEWDFTTKYEINLNGKTTSGTIPKSGNGTYVGWCPTDNSWHTGGLPISTTVNAKSDGSCPDVNLYVRVYNDSVWYINKQKYVKYSSTYDGNIAPTVRSNLGSCSMITAAGKPKVTSITSNYDGTFNTVSEMGADGNGNTVSNIHVYYGVGSKTSPTTTDKTDARGNGTVNKRIVTHSNLPIHSTSDYVDVYVRPYNITSTGSNNGGDVKHAKLQNWNHCGGATVNSITDNGDNTFTVVTTMGTDGYNNSVSNVHIYLSTSEANAQSGSYAYGLSNGVVSGRTVTFNNVSMSAIRDYFGITNSSFTIWVGAHSIAAKGNNLVGAKKSGKLTYYSTPHILSFIINKNSRGRPQAVIKYRCDVKCKWSLYRDSHNAWKSSDTTNNNDGTYTITTDLLDDYEGADDILTYCVQLRRDTGKSEFYLYSQTAEAQLDLREPTYTSCTISEVGVNVNTNLSANSVTSIGNAYAIIDIRNLTDTSTSGNRYSWRLLDTGNNIVKSASNVELKGEATAAKGGSLSIKIENLSYGEIWQGYKLEICQKLWPKVSKVLIPLTDIDTRVSEIADITFKPKLPYTIEADNTNIEKDVISAYVGMFDLGVKATLNNTSDVYLRVSDIVISSDNNMETLKFTTGSTSLTDWEQHSELKDVDNPFSFHKKYYVKQLCITRMDSKNIKHTYIFDKDYALDNKLVAQLCGGSHIRCGDKFEKITSHIKLSSGKLVRAVPYILDGLVWKASITNDSKAGDT